MGATWDCELSVQQDCLLRAIQAYGDWSAASEIRGGLRLEGPLDMDALERAANEVVRRHAVLRQRYRLDGERWRCACEPHHPTTVPLLDLPAGANGVDELTRLAADFLEAPFDVTRQPPIRQAVVRLAEREHVLLVSASHLVADSWSLFIWQRELGLLYDAFSNHEPPPLEELPLQYSDFAAWQRRWLTPARAHDCVRYWERALAAAEPPALPRDRVPRDGFHAGSRCVRTLPSAALEALGRLSRRCRASLFMTLLAALNLLLHSYSGQEDLVVATVFANRQRPEWEPLIGYFSSAALIRTDLTGDQSFEELVHCTRTSTLAAMDHQQMHLRQLAEHLPVDHLHRVAFQLHNEAEVRPARLAADLRAAPLELDLPRVTLLELAIDAWELDGELRVLLTHRPDCFSAAAAAALADSYIDLLSAAGSRPEHSIGGLAALVSGRLEGG